jgi:hypothetical protein
VTAKTSDGKEIYKNEKIYMPIPQKFGWEDKMGRGPYEKSGLIQDTSLPPLRTVTEKFTIPLYKETKKDGNILREPMDYSFNIDVELWYLPYGKKDDPGNAVMWNKFTQKITLEKGGK